MLPWALLPLALVPYFLGWCTRLALMTGHFRLGTLIEVGNMVNQGETIEIDPAKMVCAKHARILGMSANNPQSFNRAFNFLKRHQTIPFQKVYSHRTDLDGLLDTLKQKGNDDYVKGLVIPS